MKYGFIIIVLIAIAGFYWAYRAQVFSQTIVISPDIAPIQISPAKKAETVIIIDATRFPEIILSGSEMDFSELESALSLVDKNAVIELSVSTEKDPLALIKILNVFKRSGHNKLKMKSE